MRVASSLFPRRALPQMSDYQALSTADPISGRKSHALVICAYGLLLAITLWPLAIIEIPPLVDYPNHLARMHILAAIDSDPDLQKNYLVDWAIVPNLAMDAIVPILMRWFGLFPAGKIFVAICMILPVIGVAVLNRVLQGSWSLWPATALLFVFGQNLIWGFLNYLFTIGLFFLVFAAWIATERWSRGARLTLFSGLSSILYLGHFFAFSVYGLSIVAYELWKTLEARKASPDTAVAAILKRWTWILAQFLIPGVLLLMAPGWDGDKITVFGSLPAKVVALLSPVMAYGTADIETFLVLGIAGFLAFRTGWLRLEPAVRFPLLFLGVAAILMPHALQSNWYTDYRLPTVLAMLAVAGTRFTPPDRRVTLGITALAMLLFFARLVPIADRWHGVDQEFAEFRQAAQKIERGARVLSVELGFEAGQDTPGSPVLQQIYRHMVSLAVIDRSVFTPMLFTNRAAQPVQASAAMAHLDVPYGRPVWPTALRIGADPERKDELAGQQRLGDARLYWEDWPKHYDYVLFVHLGLDENPMPEILSPVETGSFFDIYKIIKDGGGASE